MTDMSKQFEAPSAVVTNILNRFLPATVEQLRFHRHRSSSVLEGHNFCSQFVDDAGQYRIYYISRAKMEQNLVDGLTLTPHPESVLTWRHKDQC